MNQENRLSSNIRCLRMAYGETQEELGRAIGVEKNAIYNYEKGIRDLDRYMIAAIAKHYSISVEELVSADLTQLGKVTVDNTVFLKQIRKIFPIVTSGKALKEAQFQTAHDMHLRIYEKISQMDFDIDEKDMDCFEKYCDAGENDEIEEEAAANIIALWYLFLLFVKRSPEALRDRSAAVNQIIKRDPGVKMTVDNLTPDFYKDADEVLMEVYTPEIKDFILECKRVLKRSSDWADLADYYLALQYVWNLVDNELPADFNSRIGVEMLRVLCSMKNRYAVRFMKFCIQALGM